MTVRPPAALMHAVTAILLLAGTLTGSLSGARAADVTPLVSVEWLAQHRGDGDLVVLDVRSAIDGGGADAYAKGHIPGSVHSDYDKGGWRVTRGGVPFMLPTVPELEKLIGELGIDEDSHVVVVPAGVHNTDFGSAARVYWTLKVAGVARLSILDGGYAAWTAARQPVATGPGKASPKIFTARLHKSLIVETGDVERIEAHGGATLVDARPASFFNGKDKAPAAKAYGHIKGAINVDNASFYDAATNRLKPQAELARIASAIPEGPAVSYCNTGHWAATDWFVLSEILGRKDVRLYYGSMVDWTAKAERGIVSARTKWDDIKKTLGFGG
ncbi:sulfurtransferase [Xanthobacteraceae bacterium Astr-EGSB]|uniref:sulfurtransferase n=1 Tax=Astrobacterium formosum TaxID=3069710 RepID=UPI0027AF49FD|nr:sulfurtransferase [Xanthobacteraceae bacterium Astr-EGSB]